VATYYKQLPKGKNMTKTLILDTNVYLTEVSSLFAFGKNNIAIPTIILDEIDKHKSRQDTAGFNARSMNRTLDNLRRKGSLFEGVSLGRGKGKVFAAQYDPRYMPAGMATSDSDNKIIAIALRLKLEGNEIAVVSRDLNMRVKCDAFGLECHDYQPQQVIKSVEKLFDGTETIEVEDDFIDAFYQSADGLLLPDQDRKLFSNQYIILIGKRDPKKSAVCRFINYHVPLRKVYNYKDIWGLSANNKEQKFAMDLLFDKDIKIVSLTGQAGTGKTLIAAASGLEQVLNCTTSQGGYDKLIITRPVQPLGRDIGFLPGTLEEKMMPWIAPIRDNLEHLFGDRTALDMQLEQGVIEIEAMTYIRGRSISNAFMVVDEAQNLTPHELKTIITRVGHGTKLILTGDIQQIDNSYVDAVSNGLTYAVEKFKEYEISGHVSLIKGERSKLATLASEIL
jgi:PhoH-like ATPase|tara:strand:- start:773 stop:2122 length:1350 start_codon:yes stop_codon:yes gene_type:complete